MTHQTVTFQHSPTPVIFLMLSALAIAVTVGLAIGSFIPANSSHPDAPLELIYSHPSMKNFSEAATISGHQAFEQINTDGMPALPDCKHLGVKKCHWLVREADFEDGHVIDVNLFGENGNLLGNTQLLEMPVSEAGAELLVMEGTTETIWVASVKVASKFRMNGIGKLMWRAGDAALSAILGSEGTGLAYRVLYDTVGWGPSLMALVDKALIVYESKEIFVYQILTY